MVLTSLTREFTDGPADTIAVHFSANGFEEIIVIKKYNHIKCSNIYC